MRDESGLESLNCVVCAPLGLEHPAVIDWANTWQAIHELPHAIVLVRGHYFCEHLSHCAALLRDWASLNECSLLT